MLLSLFWLAIIGVFIGIKEFTLRTGQEVLLKTRPVDPRDIFRGDYVILNYDISSVDVGVNNNFTNGDKVYVGLDVRGNYAIATGAYTVPPSNMLFIEGVVKRASDRSIQVEYGIESYFVPEGKGGVLERAGSNLEVRAAVDKGGNAVIKSLLIGGKEVDLK